MTGVLSRTVSPQQCVLGFGIPTTEAEFERDLHRPADKDFAPHHVRDVALFRHGLLETIEEVVPAIEDTGMAVRTAVTLAQFGELLREDRRVVILLTHWADAPVRIEFADALHAAEDVSRIVPPSFDGAIDLAVCHPIPLGAQLAFDWPGIPVAWRETTIGARFHLWFYLTLARTLKEHRMTYAQALETVIALFDEKSAKRR